MNKKGQTLINTLVAVALGAGIMIITLSSIKSTTKSLKASEKRYDKLRTSIKQFLELSRYITYASSIETTTGTDKKLKITTEEEGATGIRDIVTLTFFPTSCTVSNSTTTVPCLKIDKKVNSSITKQITLNNISELKWCLPDDTSCDSSFDKLKLPENTFSSFISPKNRVLLLIEYNSGVVNANSKRFITVIHMKNIFAGESYNYKDTISIKH